MITTILLYILVAVVVIQICYSLSFLSFTFHKSNVKKVQETIPVSVIVCAKNEKENLQTLIPIVLNQKHSNFELVLINDASADDSLELMQQFEKQDKRIKIVNVENNEAFWGNKKYALTLGIKAAKHNHLLFTDADCVPASDDWIQSMSNQFSKKKSIVLGYGAYKKKKNSLVNLLVRYETVLTAIQYFSYAKLGSAYMAVGRNLAYTKDEFYRVKGFINHIQVRSGDDDLFIKDAATNSNTTISIDSSSFTLSEAPKDLSSWFRQKRRHISTASYYKFKHQFFLGLFFISKFIFWLLAPISFFFVELHLILPITLSYLIINYLVIGISSKKLKEPQILYIQPFLEIFLVLFQITIFIANSISKPTHWK